MTTRLIGVAFAATLLIATACNKTNQSDIEATKAETERLKAETEKEKAEAELIKAKNAAASQEALLKTDEPTPSVATQPEVVNIDASLWGSIGDSNDAEMTITGNTGLYTYNRKGQQADTRTLRLNSFDKKSRRLVLDAYLGKKYIGAFDGTCYFSCSKTGNSLNVEITYYKGKFKSIKGISIDFCLHQN